MDESAREIAIMSSNHSSREPSFALLKSDAAQQRWEWFHRAIALAKKANDEAMRDSPDASAAEAGIDRRDAHLSIAR